MTHSILQMKVEKCSKKMPMSKYININIIENNTIENIIGNSLSIDNKKLNKVIKILKYNTKPILNNWNKFSHFLLMGDVQSGKTNNLIYLSYKLFIQEKVDVIFYLTGTKNQLLSQNIERFFTTFTHFGDSFLVFRNKNIDNKLLEKHLGSKIIISSLKTIYRLNKIEDLIKYNSKKIKYLIIDDEADEGSTSNDTFKILYNITNYKNVKYLAITATPFRNLYKRQNFYDYFHILKSGITYQNLSSFNKYLKVYQYDKEQIIKNAFMDWIVKCSVLNKKHSQILFNIINLNKGHDRIFRILNSTLDAIKNDKYLKLVIDKKYQDKFENFEKIKAFVEKLMPNDFIINNGITNDEPKNQGHEVIIGGIKLSRGITYKNLVSEVMINVGNVIDPGTLIQRARWLGYGKKYEEIDIYVNPIVKEAFIEAEDLIKMTKDFTLDKEYKKIFNNKKYKRLKLK